MAVEQLENSVKIKQLKTEPPDQNEFNAMVNSAKHRLRDARIESLSEEGQFILAYGAAHALALAALRWHGYRSDSRYLVFQCLQYTVGLENAQWRVLDKCHKQRNLAEYEGHLEMTPQLFNTLMTVAEEVLQRVENLGPVTNTG